MNPSDRPSDEAGKQTDGASSAVTNSTYLYCTHLHTGSRAANDSTPGKKKNPYETMLMPGLKTPERSQSTDNIRTDIPPTLDHQEDAYTRLRNKGSALVNKDREVFVPTRSYQRAQEFLNWHRMVIIRGTPSSGKTALSLSLLRHFATRGYAPLVLQNGHEWRNHVRRNRKQGILLDNVFGEVRVERTLYAEWQPLVSCVSSLVRDNPNCLVILTLHSHIIAHLLGLADSSFQDIPVVDLDALPLTPKEKKQMLKKHLATKKVKGDRHAVREVISCDRSGPLFPVCCRNYARDFSKSQYVNLRYDHEVFTTPGLVYLEFFTTVLKQADSSAGLVPLLLLALNQSRSVLSDDEQTEMKLRMLGLVTIDVDMDILRVWAQLLKGSILSSDVKQAQFRNRDLSDGFSFALYNNQSVELLLNACSVEFLVRYVHVEPTARKTDIVIDHASPYLHKLQQRICREILGGNVVQMSQHPALQSERFLKKFEAFLLETQSLKALLSAKDPVHGMPLLYWSAWSSPGVLTCWSLSNLPGNGDGKVVRQTFLACSLFGEKVNTPRVARMFQWMCEHGRILDDAVSSVSLPVPGVEDRVCDQVREKSLKVLQGQTRLTCGLSQNTVQCLPRSQTNRDNVMIFPERLLDGAKLGSSRTGAKASRVRTFPWRPPTSRESDLPSQKQDGPPTLDSLTVSQESSAASSSFSSTSSSSSGSYISVGFVPEAANVRPQGFGMATITENDKEDAGESTILSEHAEVLSEVSDVWGRGCRSPAKSLSVRSTDGSIVSWTSETGVQTEVPLPDSIVRTSVEKEEGRVTMHPICTRWYTFLRMVSLCEVDDLNSGGYALLHTAAYNGEANVVQFLVRCGADLATLTKKGNTALTKAIDHNHVEVVSYLLSEGAKALLLTTDAAAAIRENTHQDLSWMLGLQALDNIFSKLVQKRSTKMLRLLVAYGFQPRNKTEVEGLLK